MRGYRGRQGLGYHVEGNKTENAEREVEADGNGRLFCRIFVLHLSARPLLGLVGEADSPSIFSPMGLRLAGGRIGSRNGGGRT